MKRKCLSVMSMVVAFMLLFATIPVYALTSPEKENRYAEAIQALEMYLEEQEEDEEQLELLYVSFKELKGYEKSSAFASYVHVLLLLAQEEYDSFEMDYELNENLKNNTNFIDYLEKEMTNSAIGTIADLENYVLGRTAEANADEEAAEYYKACLHFFDAEKRSGSLHGSAAAEHYAKGMAYFEAGDLENAYREFEQAGKYEDSENRKNYIEKKLGYSPSHVHDWVDADCITPKTCLTCNAVEGEANGHQWDAGKVVKNATCSQEGDAIYTCQVCSIEEHRAIPAQGEHEWDEGVQSAANTCTATGKITYTCKKCGETNVEEIAKKGEHQWDNGSVTKAATCTENGTYTYRCQRCGETKTEIIAKTGEHQWNNGSVTKAATCSENGIYTYKCQRCGETKTEAIAKTGNHNWNSGKTAKDATCTTNGTKTYTCNTCGATKTETINATGNHNWNSGKVTKEATCASNGTRTYTCNTCGTTKTETISATGNHSWLAATTSAPKTCSTCGKTEGNKLTVYYRYRDLVKDSYYTSWSAWSSWSTEKKSISDSNLMEQQTQTVKTYMWWAARCKNCGTYNPHWGSDFKCKGCGKLLPKGNWDNIVIWNTVDRSGTSTYYGRKGAKTIEGHIMWAAYEEDPRTTTQYSYRTRSIEYTTRMTDWSSWSTTKPSSVEGREIETKTE